MAIKIKDYDSFGLDENLVRSESVLNDYQQTDALAFDQMYEGVPAKNLIFDAIRIRKRSPEEEVTGIWMGINEDGDAQFVISDVDGQRIEFNAGTADIDFYNNNNDNTIILDGSSTTLGDPTAGTPDYSTQVRIGGSLFLAGDTDANYLFGTQMWVGGFGGTGISSFFSAIGSDGGSPAAQGDVGTMAIRSDGEFWHYGTNSSPIFVVKDNGTIETIGDIWGVGNGDIGTSTYPFDTLYLTGDIRFSGSGNDIILNDGDIVDVTEINWVVGNSNPGGNGDMVFYEGTGDDGVRIQVGGTDYTLDKTAV